MPLYNRKTFAELRGVNVRDIAYYDDFGLLSSEKVGQERLYGRLAHRQLDFVLMCRRLKFAIPEIKNLFARVDVKAKLDNKQIKINAYNILPIKEIENKISEIEHQRKKLDLMIQELMGYFD